MKGIKFKAFGTGRKVAVLGASLIAAAGLALLGSTSAHALAPVGVLGTEHGNLTFSPATGNTTVLPTWSTSDACPAGFNFATLMLINSDYTAALPDTSIIGAQEQPGTAPIVNQQITAGVSLYQEAQFAGYNPGDTLEAAVSCSQASGNSGTKQFVQDEFITLSATGFTTSATPPAGAVTPTVTVSASPSTAQVGTSVTLTATVTASGSAVTTGTVQFSANGAAVGTPKAVNASGVATTSTSFAAAGTQSITAAYATADPTHFNNATSTTPFTLTITTSNPLAVNEIITVTVPPQGTFTFGTSDGASNPTVPLTVSGTTSLTGTGSIDAVKVTDSRTGLAPNPAVPSLVTGFNGFPGWSVVGQATDFSNPTSTPVGTIPVTALSWTPAPANGDYVPGGPATGLGTARTLGSAATGHGQGTSILGAGLSLAIPASAPAGGYTSTLTLTANPTANFS
jgi:hypothetical protein